MDVGPIRGQDKLLVDNLVSIIAYHSPLYVLHRMRIPHERCFISVVNFFLAVG